MILGPCSYDGSYGPFLPYQKKFQQLIGQTGSLYSPDGPYGPNGLEGPHYHNGPCSLWVLMVLMVLF